MTTVQRAKELRPLLERLASSLGYHERVDFPDLGGTVRICAARQGADFPTQAICFVFHSRPSRTLAVDLVASRILPPSELAQAGLRGTAIVRGLFEHQFYREGRAVEEVLPSEIPIDKYTTDELVERLGSELRAIEGRVWRLE